MKKYFILLFAILIIFGCTNRELKSGEFKTGDANIYYVEAGSGDTTLFFLHGWGINSGYWKDQMNYFSRSYKTIAIDLAGFGKSASKRKDFTLEKFSYDIIEIINKQNLRNVILIGHSMSGDISLETTVKNNKSIIGIVGVDNFKFVGAGLSPEQLKEMNSFIDTLKKNYRNVAPEYAAKYLFSSSTDTAVRNMVKKDYANSDPRAAISSIENVFKYDETAKLLELEFKLYLINSDGMSTNTEGLKKYCKNSFEVLDIHGTGHFPMIEKPEEFNRLLQAVVYKIGKKMKTKIKLE